MTPREWYESMESTEDFELMNGYKSIYKYKKNFRDIELIALAKGHNVLKTIKKYFDLAYKGNIEVPEERFKPLRIIYMVELCAAVNLLSWEYYREDNKLSEAYANMYKKCRNAIWSSTFTSEEQDYAFDVLD